MSLPEERLVSEALKPAGDGFDTSTMALGEPGLPKAFLWRKETLAIAQTLEAWKETGLCKSGKEQYTRKHWYTLKTTCGKTIKVYFERKARSSRQAKLRWWLYSISESDNFPAA